MPSCVSSRSFGANNSHSLRPLSRSEFFYLISSASKANGQHWLLERVEAGRLEGELVLVDFYFRTYGYSILFLHGLCDLYTVSLSFV